MGFNKHVLQITINTKLGLVSLFFKRFKVKFKRVYFAGKQNNRKQIFFIGRILFIRIISFIMDNETLQKEIKIIYIFICMYKKNWWVTIAEIYSHFFPFYSLQEIKKKHTFQTK